jgi:hypothetical protein
VLCATTKGEETSEAGLGCCFTFLSTWQQQPQQQQMFTIFFALLG